MKILDINGDMFIIDKIDAFTVDKKEVKEVTTTDKKKLVKVPEPAKENKINYLLTISGKSFTVNVKDNADYERLKLFIHDILMGHPDVRKSYKYKSEEK